MDAVVFVKRPEEKIAFENIIMRSAEQRPDARGGFTFAARKNDERPRRIPFTIFFPAVIGPGENRPKHGSGVAFRRTHLAVKWQHGAGFFRVVGADAVRLVE